MSEKTTSENFRSKVVTQGVQRSLNRTLKLVNTDNCVASVAGVFVTEFLTDRKAPRSPS
ncbi:hypothetical protein [Nostoc sp.]|uniref:hypothetical protein n=1 Tax=Nostoc sp. TaxID=1180 RepID=UPI002FF80093